MAAAGAALLSSAPAWAQQAPTTVSDIVVTRYRFLGEDTSGTTNLPLPIEKVPQSITMVNNDFLRAVDLKTIAEVAQYTPGAIYYRDEPAYGSTAKIRGFRAGYAIDGLPVGDFLIEPDASTVERLEFVKGPSSVVYGAATPGGIINLVSKSAAPGTPSYISALVGSWNRWRVEGQVAGALNASGTIRGIAVGAHEEADSFVHSVDRDKTVAYGGLDFDLGTGVTAFVRASYQKQVATAFDGVPFYSNGTPPPVGRSYFVGARNVDQDIKTARINAGAAWTVSPTLSFQIDANYQDVDRDGGNAYVYTIQPNGSVDTWAERFDYFGTQDANIALSSVWKLDNLGLKDSFISSSVRYQYFRYKISEVFATGNFNYFAGENALATHLEGLYARANTYSLSQRRLTYLTASSQAVIKVAQPVTVLAGLSYSRPRFDNRLVNSGPWQNFDPDPEVSFRGAVTFEPTSGLNLYGSYSESFQPQNRIDINNNVLPPLSGRQYEIGAKYVSPDRRLLLTGALFDLVQSNQQVFDRNAPDGIGRYKALGQVRHQGLELEATGQITPRWQLTGGVAFIDAKIRKDANPLIVGKTRTYLPKATASLYTIYQLGGGFELGGGVRHVGAVRTTYDRSTRDIGAYTLVDASVAYTWKTWRFQLNAKNLFDEKYYVSAYEALDYSNMPGEPSSFTLSVRKVF